MSVKRVEMKTMGSNNPVSSYCVNDENDRTMINNKPRPMKQYIRQTILTS